ncbi:hypothetical protein MNBD_GAMMA17-754 [hydrothermal vent metagenome]|uniref:Uncharacterized protein TP-0789 domain-containing protein n=1 Tax=hydrothermal vent metagenome TaxID=652676 RepID=A0A3B0ZD16_9ZZZZ
MLRNRFIKKIFSRAVFFLMLIASLLFFEGRSYAAESDVILTGEEIVASCGIKSAGDDQRSRLTVILQNTQQGTEKRSVYRRYWKGYAGLDGVFDKMLLFTEYPPDAVGSAFMRVSYVAEAEKTADQWIYLPLLKKIRRVSIRDPSDSFLNSDLTYADVGQRALSADNHKFLGIKAVQGLDFLQVESVPVGASAYGKRIQWYLRGEDWDTCASVRIDYFTKEGVLSKIQFNKWQQINGAWVWDRVLVRNMISGNVSIFVVGDVDVNIGLKDELFSARTLRVGPRALAGVGKKEVE